MLVSFVCPDCRATFRARAEQAGSSVACPKCKATVPAPAPPSPITDSFFPDETYPPGERPVTRSEPIDPDWKAMLAPAQGEDEVGRLGGYRVLGVLGAGGMGIVFRAEDPALGRLVALKVMLPGRATPTLRQRFLREARAAAAVEHEHVVAVHQVGEDRGVPFIAMPLLRGESLEARLAREGRLAPAEAARIGREIAEGLQAAHAAGLVHRDVKPANVWLEGDRGKVKLLDFGLARAGEDGPGLTGPGVVLGTPSYTSPEQARGRPVDARVDLFALGGVLYRALTGRLPFQGADVVSTLLAVVNEEPEPPASLRDDVPADLSALVMWLLAKRPEDRPATAAEAAALLAGVRVTPAASDDPVTQPFTPAASPVVRRGGGKVAKLVVAAGVLLTLAAVGLGAIAAARFGRRDRGQGDAPEVAVNEGERRYRAGNDASLGLEGPLDKALALKHFRAAAEQGHPVAQAQAGLMLWLGVGVDAADKEAGQCEIAAALLGLRRAAEAGDPAAQVLMGNLCEVGLCVAKDEAASSEWYRKAAENGSPLGMHELGVARARGRGVPKDDAEAARLYRQAAEKGYAIAMHDLAIAYCHGHGVPRDEAEAIGWFRKSAQKGCPPAAYELGVVYGEGRFVPRDEAEAARWFRRAADKGHADASNNLGWLYFHGLGVPKDEVEAVRLYRLAADKGNPRAMNNLGLAYAHGWGVGKNEVEAVRLYRLAADKGDLAGTNNLGWLYAHGAGVEKDEVEAVRLYRLAAEKGHPHAMGNLAEMLRQGRGTRKDEKEALEWEKKALAAKKNGP